MDTFSVGGKLAEAGVGGSARRALGAEAEWLEGVLGA